MLRRQALKLGSLLLGAVTLGGWTLSRRKDESPLLLSARDDTDGKHYAVGYRLDGTRVFATQVGQRCHDIINHPALPIALFVARRPGTESYLIDLRDGTLLQTLTSQPHRHFYGHAARSPPTASAPIKCRGCPMAKPWWWPTAASAPKPKAGSR
jgi:hypothetical protein